MPRLRRMRRLQKFAADQAAVTSPFITGRSLSSRTPVTLNRAAALAEWRDLCTTASGTRSVSL